MRIVRGKAPSDEAEALAVLARNRRLLVIIVPEGIPGYQVAALKRDVDARLEALVVKRERDHS